LHELIVAFLIGNVSGSIDAKDLSRRFLPSLRRPLLIIEDEKESVKLIYANEQEHLLFPEERYFEITEAVYIEFVSHHDLHFKVMIIFFLNGRNCEIELVQAFLSFPIIG